MKILLGITGSVATVLVSKLAKKLLMEGHEVQIVATNPALFFLPALDCSRLLISDDTSVNVYIDKDEWPNGGYQKNDPVQHIEFRTWADVFLIAPLTANTLAKLANGLADNFLTCIARAWPKQKPFLLAPAMNTEMWLDPISQMQIKQLRQRYQNLVIIDPIEKTLACGDKGIGAMADIDTIIKIISTIT